MLPCCTIFLCQHITTENYLSILLLIITWAFPRFDLLFIIHRQLWWFIQSSHLPLVGNDRQVSNTSEHFLQYCVSSCCLPLHYYMGIIWFLKFRASDRWGWNYIPGYTGAGLYWQSLFCMFNNAVNLVSRVYSMYMKKETQESLN